MLNTLIVDGARAFTMNGGAPHGLGVIDDARVIVEGGRITHVGPREAAPPPPAGARVIDAAGKAVMPGLVDCHTHAVFAGTRRDELALRARGASYAEIMAAGGGIRSTMRAVRAATVDALVDVARPRFARMLARGITTVEVKSGYGLSLEGEVKMLEAARALRAAQPIDVVTTLLAAHAIPPEHEGNAGAYVDVIVRDILPAAAPLCEACDVFVEKGAFSVDEGRRVLRRAQELGLAVRVHAEQLTHSGGARLAAELHAVSAGHLEHVTPADIELLASADVVCEVLSLAQVFLGVKERIPGRALVDGGCAVAVATDFNPGTAMSNDLALAAGLAVSQCGLTVEEALLGITKHAARALQRVDRGVLAPGLRGDLLILDTDSAFDLVYRWGDPLTHTVVVGGEVVFTI